MLLLFAAQFFMFVGMALSWATLFDCQLVHVNATEIDPFLASLYKVPPSQLSNRTTAGLRFFFFQDLQDGASCVLEEDISATQTGDVSIIWIESYMEFLGPTCFFFRRLQSGAQTLALILCIWLGTYCCLSHTQRLRYLWCLANLVVLCPLQISSLFILTTGFCRTYSCEIGRTYGFSITALLCFVMAAVIVLFKTRNYFPGMERIARPDRPILDDNDDDLKSHKENAVREENKLYRGSSNGLGDAVEVPISKDMLDFILSSPGNSEQRRNQDAVMIRKDAAIGSVAIQSSEGQLFPSSS